MTDPHTTRSVLGAGALGFGVAGLIAPATVAAVYGFPETTPEQRYTTRLWGSTLAALGVIGFLEDGLDDRTYLQVGAALNGVQAVAALLSPVPVRSRLMSAATSAAFGAAAFAALREL